MKECTGLRIKGPDVKVRNMREQRGSTQTIRKQRQWLNYSNCFEIRKDLKLPVTNQCYPNKFLSYSEGRWFPEFYSQSNFKSSEDKIKTFSDMQDLKILLFCTIPEKATGGWAAPKWERLRIQETKAPIPNRKEAECNAKLPATGEAQVTGAHQTQRLGETRVKTRGSSRDSCSR